VLCNLAHSLQMICDWRDYDSRMAQLVDLVSQQLEQGIFPSVHPHHTFLYPLPNPVQRAIAGAHAAAAVRFVALLKKERYVVDTCTLPMPLLWQRMGGKFVRILVCLCVCGFKQTPLRSRVLKWHNTGDARSYTAPPPQHAMFVSQIRFFGVK